MTDNSNIEEPLTKRGVGRPKKEDSEKKSKTISVCVDKELHTELTALSQVLRTELSLKARELLVEWRVRQLNLLKESSDTLYQEYNEIVKKKD